MMKKMTLVLSALLFILGFSINVHATEFTMQPIDQTMYTISNTQVYLQPDQSQTPVLLALADIPVQVKAITSTGWYQIVVNDGTYYIPGNQLAVVKSHAPVQLTIKDYQQKIETKVNSIEEMQGVIAHALEVHATTVVMKSDLNMFQEVSAYLNSLLGGENGTYSEHNSNSYQLNRRNNVYTLNLGYLSTIEEEQALDVFVLKTCGNFIASDTRTTIKNVHDYICGLTDYSDATAQGLADYASAYDAVMNHQTVCTGYALLFQKYMDILGIPSTTAAGYRNNEPHMWNIVNVDGQWYHIDCTWDDQKTYVSNRWFLCGADLAGYNIWGNIPLAATTLN